MLAAAAFVCLGELLADSWLGRRYSLRYLTRHQLMELTHKVSLVGPLVDPLVGPLVGPPCGVCGRSQKLQAGGPWLRAMVSFE